MQVAFGEHPYLFVNPRLKGKNFPPTEGATPGHWHNYGGDKIWPLPEGEQDEAQVKGRIKRAVKFVGKLPGK